MTRCFLLVVSILGMGVMASQGRAAFLSETSFLAAVDASNKALIAFPSQTIVSTDSFGSYAPDGRTSSIPLPTNQFSSATSGSRSFLPATPTGSGQLSGEFGCFTPVFPCLGAHTVTYTLPFKVFGLGGDLSILFATRPEDFPFFGIRGNDYATNIATGNTPFRYTGFWGTVFDRPVDSFSVTWTAGVTSTDATASFRLLNAVALVAPGTVVRVPEPGSAALFLFALFSLAWLWPRLSIGTPRP